MLRYLHFALDFDQRSFVPSEFFHCQIFSGKQHSFLGDPFVRHPKYNLLKVMSYIVIPSSGPLIYIISNYPLMHTQFNHLMIVRSNEHLLEFFKLPGNVEVAPHQLLRLLLRPFANVLLWLVNFRQLLFLHLNLNSAQKHQVLQHHLWLERLHDIKRLLLFLPHVNFAVIALGKQDCLNSLL